MTTKERIESLEKMVEALAKRVAELEAENKKPDLTKYIPPKPVDQPVPVIPQWWPYYPPPYQRPYYEGPTCCFADVETR